MSSDSSVPITPNSDKSPDKIMLGYQATLKAIQRELKPSAALHEISRFQIDMFRIELSRIIEEMDNLKDTSGFYEYTDSSLSEFLINGIIEIFVAMKLLDMIERGDRDMINVGDTWRSVFGCLIKCEKYLSEALVTLDYHLKNSG